METKIELREMRFYAHHGVGEQETVVGNWFTVDLALEAPLGLAVESDDLSATINYAEVYEVVKVEMAVPSKLIEHVAGRIMRALKVRFPQLTAIDIRLAKRNPPFGGDIREAGEVFLKSGEFSLSSQAQNTNGYILWLLPTML